MTINFGGNIYDDAGNAVSGASVKLLKTGTSTQEGSTVTSDSDGRWDFSEADQDRYDVEITKGSSVRRIKWSDEISLQEIDVRNNTAAGTPAATFTNLRNSASNQVAVFSGANSTKAAGDEIYLSFKLHDSAGNLDEFARMTVEATDVTTTNEDGQIRFGVIVAGTLTDVFTINSTTGGAAEISYEVDSFTIKGGEGEAGVLYLFADQGDDAGDEWKINVADGGVLTIGNDIASAGTYVTMMTITPHATTASSSVAIAGDATVGDDLSLTSDSAVINMGAGNDFTITHDGTTGATLAGTPITVNSTGALTLDSSTDITLDADGADVFLKDGGSLFGTLTNSSGQLVIKSSSSGTTAATFSGANVTLAGTVGSGAITSSGIIKTDDTTEATSTTDGSLQTDGGLSVAKDAVFGDDVFLLSDSAVFNMGAGNDFTITHDGTTGATIAGNPVTITAGGASTWSTSSGALTITSAAALNLNPASGSAILLDGTISVDAGVVTGASSITSTAFVGTLSTAAQANVTSLGTLTALTVDDVAINGKVVTMTGSSSDTAVFTAGTNGTLSIVTTDAAAAAANIQITADGTAELAGTTVTLDSAADIELEATNDINVPSDVGLTFGNDGEKIEGDGTNLYITSGGMTLSTAASAPAPDNNKIHLWSGTAGNVTAYSASLLVLEHSDSVSINFLSPNDAFNSIYFGDEDSATVGGLIYLHDGDIFRIRGAGANVMDYDTDGHTWEFANATSIQTSAGDLKLEPSGDVNLNNGSSLINASDVTIGADTDHGTTAGTHVLSIFNGTPPAGTLTNGASFFCASGEMKVIDAAGNVTVLSPHDDDGNWIFNSKDSTTGKVLHVHMEKLMRKLNDYFGGGFIEEYEEAI